MIIFSSVVKHIREVKLSHFKLENNLKSFDSNKLIKSLKWILLVAVIAIIIVFSLYFSNFHDSFSTQNSTWGTFGDFIGGTLNPILSFLALIALLFTIVLQNKELEATREELKRAANAHEKSKDVMDKQYEALKQQKFEATFFSLLDQHNQLLQKLTDKLPSYNGSTIDYIYSEVFTQGTLPTAIQKLKKKSDFSMEQYFRVLYQLLKFIVTNQPSSKKINPRLTFQELLNKPLRSEEKTYSNMLRSYIPSKVFQLLALNCYCKDQNDSYWNYKVMLERYEFLEHMPFELYHYSANANLLMPLIKHYGAAFGDSDYIRDLPKQDD